MPKVIPTASEWTDKLSKLKSTATQEKREFIAKKALELKVENMRDDVMSIVYNTYGSSDEAYEQVHGNMGAHPSTLRKWQNRKVRSPKISTLLATLEACGKTLLIGDLKGG